MMQYQFTEYFEQVVGIDIDNASHKVELKELILSKLPTEKHLIAA